MSNLDRKLSDNVCYDLNFGATNAFGEDCAAYVGASQSICEYYGEDYGDEDFDLVHMCCSCGGGERDADLNWLTCTNTDDGVLNNWGGGCSPWYDNYPDGCDLYDDEDFVAEDLCCACGGG